ncbi:MAG: sugar phosphate isomerase/epimerase family protein [Thermomicrobiales bacterium]
MKYAIFSVSLPEWRPDEAVRQLAEIGYDGVEWRIVDDAARETLGFWQGNRCTFPLSSFVDDAPHIRALTEGAGMGIPAIASYVQADDLENVERVLRGMKALGVPMGRIQVPRYDGITGFADLRDQTRAHYREVERLARDYGVKALVEIHHNTITPSASATRLFLDGFDPDAVGAIYDPGNMVHEGHERYRLGLETLGPYLAHVHIKNAGWRKTGEREDGATAWEGYWAPLDAGIVNLRELFGALHAIGYDEWVSVEDFTTEQPLTERVRGNLALMRSAANATA